MRQDLLAAVARSTGTVSLAGYLPPMPSWAEVSQVLPTDAPMLRYGLMLGATAMLILGPVALYFAFRRD